LKERLHLPEYLDNPDLSGKDLTQVLNQLDFINQALFSNLFLIRAIDQLVGESKKKELTIVDIGCGSGKTLQLVVKHLKNKGVSCKGIGIDLNPNTIEFATQNNTNEAISFLEADVESVDFNVPTCDIFISSHFMYHFNDTDFLTFIQKILPCCSAGIVINELQRHKVAHVLFRVFCEFFTLHPIIKEDGLLAIKRSWTYYELLKIMQSSAFHFTLKKQPFFRQILTIKNN
jgi:SAM-dependent methyltransferase